MSYATDPCAGCPVSAPSSRGVGEECWRCLGIDTKWELPPPVMVPMYPDPSEDIPFCPALETLQKGLYPAKPVAYEGQPERMILTTDEEGQP